MIDRRVEKLLLERLGKYPAVALVGPRQAGKTTLAKSLGGSYFDLEQGSGRVQLDIKWESLIEGKELIVLDEAQTWPEVFPRMRGAIDMARKRKGRFLILGSVSPGLMHRVSESLAGRLSIAELTPFLKLELPRVGLDKMWLFGGYPDGGVLKKGTFPQWQRDYLDLLSQRDLPNWGLHAKPQLTRRLLAMVAAVHGQVWNATQIANNLGLTHPTVNTYMDYLEGAYLVRRLPAYRANLRKRLIKSPKYYWRDSGLLHAILNITTYDDLLANPFVGASWEGFVIEQILGTLAANGVYFESFYFRTSDQHELDLVLALGREIWAIEVKLTSSPSPVDLRRLNKVADLISAKRRILISRTRRSTVTKTQVSASLRYFIDEIIEKYVP